MATIFETHLVPFQEEVENQDNQTVILRSFTRNPKVPFTRDLYPRVRKESQESLLDEVESTYAEEINGKDLIDTKIIITPSAGILTVKYIYK